MYEAQATQTRNEAAYAADAAKQQAEKIRRLGQAQRGEAAAALAGSGVKLGEGTALEIDKNITHRTEEDAFTAILGGKRAIRAGDAQASMLKTAGSNAQTAGYMQAGATVLQAGGAYAKSGWKSTAAASGGGPVPGYSSGDLGSGLRVG